MSTIVAMESTRFTRLLKIFLKIRLSSRQIVCKDLSKALSTKLDGLKEFHESCSNVTALESAG